MSNIDYDGILLPIIEEPDPILRMQAIEVSVIDDEIRQIMNNMLATLHHVRGIGLAANQVAILKRIIVIDIDYFSIKRKINDNGEDVDNGDNGLDNADFLHGGKPLFMVNPEIIYKSKECIDYEEGCFSVPGVFGKVNRPITITVRYLDYYGNLQELNVSNNLLAICIQHEIDHINGILYIDHLSKLKRDLLLIKLRKIQKCKAEA